MSGAIMTKLKKAFLKNAKTWAIVGIAIAGDCWLLLYSYLALP